jgi:hypothetical protein
MIFDEKYYKDIWGKVHRHDYCNSLADSLIQKYGKVRFLDLGAGCGMLVKCLLDKGAFAYGLDISQYAIENSHGNLVFGSVLDIPFKDNSFDVVFSQGLWEYIAEADISKAWQECSRVGKIQDHNIDTTQDISPWSKDFVTYKSREWWDKKLQLPKILIACPNHEVKEYSFQRWIDNVKSLTYPNYDIFVSDNSPNEDFIKRWKNQVPMERIDTKGMEALGVKRQNYSMEQIRQKFLNGDYERLMVIESDIIPPPNVIEEMMKWGKDSDWISHAYPARDGGDPDEQKIQGIGCSLFTRRLMEKYDFMSLEDNYMADGGMWMKVRPDKSMRTLEMWNYFRVQHLQR